MRNLHNANGAVLSSYGVEKSQLDELADAILIHCRFGAGAKVIVVLPTSTKQARSLEFKAADHVNREARSRVSTLRCLVFVVDVSQVASVVDVGIASIASLGPN